MDALVAIIVGFVKDHPVEIAMLFLASEIIGALPIKENTVVQVILNIISNVLAALKNSMTKPANPPNDTKPSA